MTSRKQLQAAYVLPAVHEALIIWAAKDDSRQLQLQGLWRSLSTFDVVTTIDLQPAKEVDAQLAVVTNLLTRGLPTLPSVFFEEQISRQFGATERNINEQFGAIAFSFKKDWPLSVDNFFAALHPIEPSLRSIANFYDNVGLDSNFEKAFVTDYLKPAPFIAQVLEKQRPLESMVKGYSKGRVDFSLEVPYLEVHTRVNRYNNSAQVRYNRAYVVEVDGNAYHDFPIDQQRDYAVASMGHNTTRIKEYTASADAASLLAKLGKESYVQRLGSNFNRSDFATDVHTQLVLVPLAAARIQRTILAYLLSAVWRQKSKNFLRLAVLERDIVAANIAIKDLDHTFTTFAEISQGDWVKPLLQCKVYKNSAALITHLGNYDLVLDVSMLRRTGVFAEDRELMEKSNVVVLRNSHYVDDPTSSPVISAQRVKYVVQADSPTTAIGEKKDENAGLTKLLNDIFRKQSFRAGQLPILKRALNGQSVIGLLPTGGGKSLTYQLAALLQPGLTIVVDPIRSLMADQDRSLKSNLIDKTTFVNSTLSTAERTYIQNNLLPEGRLHFLFVSPERFVIEEFRNVLTKCGNAGHFTTYVVIDEAHCVSEWGHDFRVPYLNLGENAQEFCPTYNKKPVPLFGLTATASFDVLADIERELKIQETDGGAVVRFENTVRDEINYTIKHVSADFSLAADPITKYDPNKIVGIPKQRCVFELLEGKGAVLQPYDDYAAIRKVAQHSYESYLSDAEISVLKYTTESSQDAKEWYCNQMAKRVWFGTSGPAFSLSDSGKFSYGIVVFAPHRTGWLGIRNGNRSLGVFDNHEFVTISDETLTDAENNTHQLPTAQLKESIDRLGYFMGSSDEDSNLVAKNDLISFTHMDRFTANENSVMAATKAFGMGIDKPNIRLTVHLNIPSSIESYVQEAGRGGRDRKSALSVILFNDERITYLEDGKEITVNVDEDVLNFFHKRSFKGQLKERTMLFELRNRIKVPRLRRKLLIVEQLQSQFENLYSLEINYWSREFPDGRLERRVYVNAPFLEARHSINLATGECIGNEVPEGFWASLQQALQPGIAEYGIDDRLRNWLNEYTYPDGVFTGIERQFRDFSVGDKGELSVYFTNTFYSKPAREADFVLNEKHFAYVYKYKLFDDGHPFTTNLETNLRSAVSQDLDYEGFIELFDLSDENRLYLLDDNNVDVQKLQRAFYANRGPQETAKAIYRLSSIGIIDTYTIDYNNKRYNLRFTKREDSYYFLKLQELIARYTSPRRAGFLVDRLREAKQPAIEAGEATPISVCLEYLTTYIYDNIRRKRKQAISDMVALCRQAIKIEDKLEQNLLIKDEIFYYFNAKYSRPGFIEPERNQPASMPDDHDGDYLSTLNFIEKYLDLVEDSDTGEFVNNNKHLRGSCMRMLRSYPDAPQYFILKSFSLFVISVATLPLRQEAFSTLADGLLLWKQEEVELNFTVAIAEYKKRLKKHVAFDVDAYVNDAINFASVNYYADWLHKFNNQLLPSNV